jgi:diguanylate cyclase (GGDEF)-like protein
MTEPSLQAHLPASKAAIELIEAQGQVISERWGGEEFIILFRDADIKAVSFVAERVRSAVENKQIHSLKRNITISIGLAIRLPDESQSSLIKRADNALFEAKHNGRNQMVLSA